MNREDEMKIGIVGSGSIGRGLAYAFAGKGAEIVLIDIRPEALEAAMEEITALGTKAVAKGKLGVEQAFVLATRIRTTTDYADLAECDLVIEAATENIRIKCDILREIEKVVREDCLIGFTTSSLTRTTIAEKAEHPERCYLTHPFFPAWRNPVMEVVLTGNEVNDRRLIDLLTLLGKVPIVVQDSPCLVGNVLFCGLMNWALEMVEMGWGTVAQVNAILADRLGGGGVFRVHDSIPGSNLLTLVCLQTLAEHLNGWFKDLYVPRAELVNHAESNELWLCPDDDATSYSREQEERVIKMMWSKLEIISDRLVSVGIVSAFDLNWIARNALGFMANPIRGLTKDVKVEVENAGIAVVTVFRPPVNPLCTNALCELAEEMTVLEENPEVHGIILSGFNGTLAGADIGELAALRSATEMAEFPLRGQALGLQIQRMTTPVVAVIDGPCLGGGAELAMSCHFRVVGLKAVIGWPEVDLGIIPGNGTPVRLTF
ncbi:enoyl-CoA hydratase/isomerase family protein [Candidatus Uhrbacteria bacterium]|nr:enoyl-CoA hydratase/isomerase family protein [Candidatus Uhrbacteria bacterium]